MRVVNPGSDAFAALRNGLCAATAAHMLAGPDLPADAAGAARSALARAGAAALAGEVRALAADVAAIAAAGEAVHGDVYAALLGGST